MALCLFSTALFAAPETTAVRVTDVTTSSFSVVWMTDVAATPRVEVYNDAAMRLAVVEGITITSMPGISGKVADAARTAGIMKVRVSGVSPAASYYVRTVTPDPADPSSIGYSNIRQVTTAAAADLYRNAGGSFTGRGNDLISFPAYVRPADGSQEPGMGNLLLAETDGSPYPVTAFVGEGAPAPEGVLDLNNLFSADGMSLDVTGGEKMTIMLYRGGKLSTLTHYRKAPLNTGAVSVAGLLKGYFADINLDGAVDDRDFRLFKARYRSTRSDAIFNPDYDFTDDQDGKVDVRDFSAFAKEYGRTDVQ